MEGLILEELNQKGFLARMTKSGVLVSLNRRSITSIEVKLALVQSFEEIEFTLVKIGKDVLVRI